MWVPRARDDDGRNSVSELHYGFSIYIHWESGRLEVVKLSGKKTASKNTSVSSVMGPIWKEGVLRLPLPQGEKTSGE